MTIWKGIKSLLSADLFVDIAYIFGLALIGIGLGFRAGLTTVGILILLTIRPLLHWIK